MQVLAVRRIVSRAQVCAYQGNAYADTATPRRTHRAAVRHTGHSRDLRAAGRRTTARRPVRLRLAGSSPATSGDQSGLHSTARAANAGRRLIRGRS